MLYMLYMLYMLNWSDLYMLLCTHHLSCY